MKFRTSSFVKYRIKKYIPSSVWAKLASNIENKRNSEYKQRYINNSLRVSEPKIFVIRRRPPGGGLFSNVNHVLQGIEYAKNENLIPVVDMKNYWTSYSQRGKFNGSKNSWDYFFEPVSNVRLEYAYKNQNLILSKGDRILPSSPLADHGLKFIIDRDYLSKYSALYIENIRLNRQTQEYINRVKEFLEWETSSLGVSFRGTDYISMQPTGHAKQPSYLQLRSRVENKLIKNNFSKIFISTEDIEAREAIFSVNPEATYKRFREKRTLERLLSDRHRHSHQTIAALGYLAEIYLLAECQSITCSIANGSASAFLINGGKYLEPDVIDLGVYG